MDDAANPIEAIFAEALLQGDLERRAAYLASACGEDRRLRGRVEALIKAHEEAGNFMASPAAPSLGDTVDAAPARAAAADPLAEKPGSVIGHYKLLQRIGEGGGFGVVWMADQERPVRRRVALKIKLVKLRYFAGLSVEESAAILEISRATADRWWAYARALLYFFFMTPFLLHLLDERAWL